MISTTKSGTRLDVAAASRNPPPVHRGIGWWRGVCQVLATLSLALPFQASAAETLRVGHFPNLTHVQALVARSMERQGQGWFSQRLGGDVKLEWYAYNAGPSAMEAIFANAIDITYVGPNPALNAYSRSRGDEIRVVSGAVNGGSALVVQPDGGLAKPADFKGKRIATPQFGNTQDVAARAWLANGGLRITQTGGDAQVIPTQNPDQLALFKSRQLDAVWTVEPWISRLEFEAGGKVLVEEPDAITTVLVSSSRALQERRDLVRKFVAAHQELTQWIKANPEEAKRMVRDELRLGFRTDLSEELVARAWIRMVVTSQTSLEAFQEFVESAQKVGFLRDTPNLAKFIEAP